MRTAILIAIGLLLAFAILRLVKPERRRAAALAVTVGWFAVVVWNLLTGMSHGYSFQVELPIQIAILIPPVALAWWLALRRRFEKP